MWQPPGTISGLCQAVCRALGGGGRRAHMPRSKHPAAGPLRRLLCAAPCELRCGRRCSATASNSGCRRPANSQQQFDWRVCAGWRRPATLGAERASCRLPAHYLELCCAAPCAYAPAAQGGRHIHWAVPLVLGTSVGTPFVSAARCLPASLTVARPPSPPTPTPRHRPSAPS